MASSIECVDEKNTWSPLSSYDLREAFSPLCAGYIAGSCGIIVGHPLDSLKVLLQTGNHTPSSTTTPLTTATTTTNPINQPLSSAAAASPNRNLSSVANRVTNNNQAILGGKRSLRSLYAGMGGPLISIGLVQSINFAFYDTFRRALYAQQHGHDETKSNGDYLYNDSLANVAISSTAAGSLISFITSPLMVVKTKQQIMLWSMKKAAKDTLRHQGGFRNFYAGFGPHFYCDGIGRGVYFTSYEYLKRYFINRNQEIASQNFYGQISYSSRDMTQYISLPERMVCAGVAGMVCWTFIFPFDVIRSKIYAQAALLPTMSDPPNAWKMTQDLWQKGGIKPFFRGFSITVARAGPVAAVVLPVYDMTLDWLQSN